MKKTENPKNKTVFVLRMVSVPKPLVSLSFNEMNMNGSGTASLYGISQLFL